MDCHHEQKKQLWEENKLETRKGNIFHLFQRLIHSAGNFVIRPASTWRIHVYCFYVLSNSSIEGFVRPSEYP